MDQVCGQALATYRRLVEREREGRLVTARELETGLRA
jgi:hypothetical protein